MSQELQREESWRLRSLAVTFGDTEFLEVSTEFASPVPRVRQDETDEDEETAMKRPLLGDGYQTSGIGLVEAMSTDAASRVLRRAGICVAGAATVAATVAAVLAVADSSRRARSSFIGAELGKSLCSSGDSGDWAEWSPCSSTCGDPGREARWRVALPEKCRNEAHAKNGKQQRTCSPLLECPDTPCVLGDWQKWGGCDGSACGLGVSSSRVRDIVVARGPTGRPCQSQVESEACARPEPCPAFCKSLMGSWEPWSDCSAMCDLGRRWRVRSLADANTSSAKTLVAVCEAHAREFQPCEPESGRCACVKRAGAAPCAASRQAPAVNGTSVVQQMQLVGLRAPRERHHVELSSATARDELLRVLSVESGGSSGITSSPPVPGGVSDEVFGMTGPLVHESVPSLGIRVGWRLVQVSGSVQTRFNATALLSALEAIHDFPAEVAVEGLGGSFRKLSTCLESWLSKSVLQVSHELLVLAADKPRPDGRGGRSLAISLFVRCWEPQDKELEQPAAAAVLP
ncbi:unnamed protein product, partial [Polarella glacialis]